VTGRSPSRGCPMSPRDPAEPYTEAWHTVTVTLIPTDADGPAEVDHDIEHPPSCEIDPGQPNYLAYRCGFDALISERGIGDLELAEAGTYRARFVYWPRYYGNGDPEAEILVERVAEVPA
jgi:hypothetical protein